MMINKIEGEPAPAETDPTPTKAEPAPADANESKPALAVNVESNYGGHINVITECDRRVAKVGISS